MEISKVSNISVPSVASANRSPLQHDKHPLQHDKHPIQQSAIPEKTTEKTTDEKLSPKQMQELVNETNQLFKLTKKNVKVQVHESLNSNYVQILNSETDQVISEIPAKKFLNMVAKFQEAVGIIIDEKY
jgi:flagellar protein FlaG